MGKKEFINDLESRGFRLVKSTPAGKHDLVAILRIRNESLILEDTLHYLASRVDSICVLDDASTDNSLEICLRHPAVRVILSHHNWRPEPDNRLIAETLHRHLLFEAAKVFLDPDWVLCADADERIFGNVRRLTQRLKQDVLGVRISLFDAYLTPNDSAPVQRGQKLNSRRKYFGPERRDILMLFRNSEAVRFTGLDAREPVIQGEILTKLTCQHFGKAISVPEWEATCDYYVNHFPWDPYGKKWSNRRGGAVHTQSDFGTPLYKWGRKLFRNAIKIHPS